MASSLRYQKICLAVIRIAKDRRREIKMKKNNQPKYQKKSVIYIPTQLGSRRLRLYSKRLVLIRVSFVLNLGRHALSRLVCHIVTIMMLLSCMCQHLSQSWGRLSENFCLVCVRKLLKWNLNETRDSRQGLYSALIHCYAKDSVLFVLIADLVTRPCSKCLYT